MTFRFAIISDPHIAIPQTINRHAHRFHLVEVSIPAIEKVFDHLSQLELDFILLPGDLTQDGEPENHTWLQQRLSQLPIPAYVVPGNHDVPTLLPTENTIGLEDFPSYYQSFGYDNPQQLYYTQPLRQGIQLIGLNSNQFDAEGKQLGLLDEEQLAWLDQQLTEMRDQWILVMIHHNVIEHLPGQTTHELGRRYMLKNAEKLLKILDKARVKLILTGHLHIQDIAFQKGIYEITTGSLVSYPHPYRVIECNYQRQQQWEVKIQSYRVNSVTNYENLPQISRQWLGDRSYSFMMRLLTAPPVNLSMEEADQLAPKLRDFWADIAAGDNLFDFLDFPPHARAYFQQFGAVHPDGRPNFIDNQTTLIV